MGELNSWLAIIKFSKFVDLRFAEFVLLDVILDIIICFKCWNETLWFHLEHLQYKILTSQILFLQILYGWNLEGIYFNLEETFIEFSNPFHWQYIILEFFASW